jgi:hypothetical protein
MKYEYEYPNENVIEEDVIDNNENKNAAQLDEM